MTVDEARQRLREDLRQAMRAGAKDEVGLIRALAAAIDNAEAVPVAGMSESISPLRASEGMGEVARIALDETTVTAIFVQERDERLAAAETFDQAGQADAAGRMRTEAAMIGRYL